MSKKPKPADELSQEDVARIRDETVKRMIATPPKKQSGEAKRVPKKSKK